MGANASALLTAAELLKIADRMPITDKVRYGMFAGPDPGLFGFPLDVRKSPYAPVGGAYIIEHNGRTIIFQGPTWREYIAEGFVQCRRDIARLCPLTCPPEWIP